MYLLNITAKAPREEVLSRVETHIAWAKKHVDAGDFIVAGPKRESLGGIVFVKSMDKARLMKIIAEDALITENLLECQVIDFEEMFVSESLREAETA